MYSAYVELAVTMILIAARAIMKIAQLSLAGKLHTNTDFNILNFAAEFPPQLMNHHVLNSNTSTC